MIREATNKDLNEILELYLYLHEDSIPKSDTHLEQTWEQIICDPNHHLIVNEVDGRTFLVRFGMITQTQDETIRPSTSLTIR